MKKKLPIVLSLALLLVAKMYPQQPDFLFEHQYPYPLPLTLAWEHPETFALEVTQKEPLEGFYLITAGEGKNSEFYETTPVSPPVVYKVSLEGEVLSELVLEFENNYSIIASLFDSPDEANWCLAVGTVHDNDLHYDRPFMAKFDYDLNLLWLREIELPEAYHGNIVLSAIMDSSGAIACCLGVSGISAPVFCRLTTEGELISIGQYSGPCNLFVITCGSWFEFQDGSGDYGKTVGYYSDTIQELYLVRINRDLELVSNTIIPSTIQEGASSTYQEVFLAITSLIYAIFPLPDGSVFLGTDATLARIDFQYNWTIDEVICFLRLNQECNVITYGFSGQGEMGVGNDSIKAIQGATCTDMVGDDAFYYYYTVGEPNGFGYDWINCFVVTKMDLDGNIIWQRYWDRYYPEYDMKVYYPFSLLTTSDDGCLVSGYCYYSDIYGSNRHGTDSEIFMLKFFSDGSFSLPEAETFIRPYVYYPNPTQDQLNLQYSPDVRPKTIELYDLQGRLVRTQSHGLESVDLQDLAPGQYLMKVTLEGGKSYTDKVMKE